MIEIILKVCEEKAEKETFLCKNCKHYDYCIIKRSGPVYYCDFFDFIKEKEKK